MESLICIRVSFLEFLQSRVKVDIFALYENVQCFDIKFELLLMCILYVRKGNRIIYGDILTHFRMDILALT